MSETSDINRNLSELEEELKKIKSAAELITEARIVAEKTIEETKQLSTISEKLVNVVETLVAKIDKIDFPSRLDKVDATISGINSGMQNLLSRLETIERHFEESIKQLNKELNTRLEIKTNEILKSTKLNRILIAIVIVLVIILLSMPYLIK